MINKKIRKIRKIRMEAEITPKSNIALARKKSIYQAGNA